MKVAFSSENLYRKIIILFFTFGEILSTTTSPTCVPDTTRRDKWLKEDYPNPQIDIGRCGRNCKESFVCDPGYIISNFEADQLDALIDTVANSGKCDCTECSYPDGYNVSIALVPAIDTPSWSDKQSDARAFTQYLRQNWNFQKCDNNIVIFVSRGDRKIYTDAGSNAYQVLTLACIEAVYNDVKQIFTNGEYYRGLTEMINHYKTILQNGNCNHVKVEESTIVGIAVGIVFGLFFIMFVIAFVCICRRNSGACHAGNGHHHHHHHNGHHSTWGGGGGGGGGFSGGGGGDGGGGGGGGGGDGGGGGGGVTLEELKNELKSMNEKWLVSEMSNKMLREELHAMKDRIQQLEEKCNSLPRKDIMNQMEESVYERIISNMKDNSLVNGSTEESLGTRPIMGIQKRLLMPDSTHRIAFTAVLTHKVTLGFLQPIEFDKIITNIGNAYDTSDGHFIAPVRGIYLLSASFVSHNDRTQPIEMVRNGNQLSCSILLDTRNYNMGSQTVVVLLEKADKIWLRRYRDTGSASLYAKPNEPGNSFSGVLLYDM